MLVGTGPQLPNCQTQCHFSWLVVSPLGQKSTRSGNLVLAGILAFYAIKTASLSPPRPSRYLHFSSAHGRCTTGVLLVDVGAHSPLAACTFKWFDPAKYFLTWYTLSDERSAPQLQSFLVRGRGLGSSTRSSTFIARVHYSCTSVYLITWTAYLRILHTCHYDVMVGYWFTGQGKKGDCVGKKVNGGPVLVGILLYTTQHTHTHTIQDSNNSG